MSDETESVWITTIKCLVILFAIIGVFSALGYFQNWNHQMLLYDKNSISENVTVISADNLEYGYASAFVATNNKGYVMSDIYSFSRIDKIVIGHTYTIKYFCNPLDGNRRTVMEMIDLKPNPYECVTIEGVCK